MSVMLFTPRFNFRRRVSPASGARSEMAFAPRYNSCRAVSPASEARSTMALLPACNTVSEVNSASGDRSRSTTGKRWIKSVVSVVSRASPERSVTAVREMSSVVSGRSASGDRSATRLSLICKSARLTACCRPARLWTAPCGLRRRSEKKLQGTDVSEAMSASVMASPAALRSFCSTQWRRAASGMSTASPGAADTGAVAQTNASKPRTTPLIREKTVARAAKKAKHMGLQPAWATSDPRAGEGVSMGTRTPQ